MIALASDTASFFAFERPDSSMRFALRGDSLVASGRAYALTGRGKTGALKPLFASRNSGIAGGNFIQVRERTDTTRGVRQQGNLLSATAETENKFLTTSIPTL